MKYVDIKSFDMILTILSVLLGFALTAISVIATSSYSVKLYNIEDSKDNSKTLLHILIDKFKSFIYWSLATLISILLFRYLGADKWTTMICEFKASEIYTSLIWGLTGVSLVAFIPLVKNFMGIVIKSASYK